LSDLQSSLSRCKRDDRKSGEGTAVKRKVAERIELPKDIVFSVDDWKDLYRTLLAFKKRVLKRRKEDGKVI
jgi:hypothetical protein